MGFHEALSDTIYIIITMMGMTLLLHHQSGNEHRLDSFVWNLVQNKPKMRSNTIFHCIFSTRKLAILYEDLKKLLPSFIFTVVGIQ